MSISNQNMIANPQARKKRKDEKQYLVLRFLRQVLWSSQEILQVVMKLQSRQAAHKSLVQMELAGLIKAHKFEALGGKLKLWGITAHGQTMAFNLGTEKPYSVYFEPTRISEQLIRHQLDLQKLRIKAELIGWENWQDGDRLGALNKSTKRPDAIALNSNGLKVAIECERSFKTIKRYEQILLSYLLLIKNNTISEVIWVSPTQDFAKRLEVLVKSIKKLKLAGQIVQIEPEKHHKNLYFCSYEDWPNYR
jgi:hypothetical protein